MTQETVQTRNIRPRADVPVSNGIPTLDELSVECRAASARLQLHEKAVSRSTEEALRGWLEQAERLAIVIDVHHLKGKAFETWAAKAGINPRRAYDVYKLHAHRDRILLQCEEEERESTDQGDAYRWPSWKKVFRQHCHSASEPPYDDTYVDAIEPSRSHMAVHYSSNRDDWATPWHIFNHYDRLFHFTLDVAASKSNAKCQRFFTKQVDGLKQKWTGTCWLNPAFSDIEKWCKKAYESAKAGATVVALLPVRTDTRWFHDHVSHGHVKLLQGRITFVDADGPAPFPSMVVVWNGKSQSKDGRLTVTLEKMPRR
jgi:phage N-6-adenine-methyltransferase